MDRSSSKARDAEPPGSSPIELTMGWGKPARGFMQRKFLLHGILLFLVGLLGFVYGGIFGTPTVKLTENKPTHMDNRLMSCNADGSVVYVWGFHGIFCSKDFGKTFTMISEEDGPDPQHLK